MEVSDYHSIWDQANEYCYQPDTQGPVQEELEGHCDERAIQHVPREEEASSQGRSVIGYQ